MCTSRFQHIFWGCFNRLHTQLEKQELYWRRRRYNTKNSRKQEETHQHRSQWEKKREASLSSPTKTTTTRLSWRKKEENLGCSWNSSVKGFFGRIFGSLPLVLSSSFLCLLVKVSWSQRQTGKEEDRFVLCVLLFFTDSYTRKRKKFLRETNIPFALSWLRHFFFLSYILTLTEEERKGCFFCVNNIKWRPARSLLQDNGQ